MPVAAPVAAPVAVRLRATCLLLVTVLATACGSTVQSSSTVTGGPAFSGAGVSGGNGLAGSSDAGSTGGSPGDATGAGMAGSAGSGGAGTTGGASAIGTSGGTAGSTAGTPGVATGGTSGGVPESQGLAGPGVTATTIYLGAVYSTDTSQANAAIGAGSSKPADMRDYYNAAIDDVNSRGGVLGRRLKPVYSELKATSTTPIDQQYQSACDTWFKDHKVFAVHSESPVVYQCTAKAGALVVGGGTSTGPVYAKFPQLIGPDAIRLERLSAITVGGMVAMGWHKPSTGWPTGRIGVLTWDDPVYRYGYDHGLVPALRAHGLVVTDKQFVSVPQTANSIAESGAAISNAILRFSRGGVDHVFIQDGPAGIWGGGGLTLQFLRAADSQSYYPRYGFNANNFPANAAYPTRAQRGMLAINSNDYTDDADTGLPANPARVRCLAVMKKHELVVDSEETRGQATLACDFVFFIETLLKRAGNATRASALSAVNRLGTSFASSFTYQTRLGNGRRDGVELFRTSRYEEGCSCMRYASRPFAP